MLNSNVVVFVSTINFLNQDTAGYNRVINYSRALALQSVSVILFSFNQQVNSSDDFYSIDNNILLVKNKKKHFLSRCFPFLSFIKLQRVLSDYNTVFVFYPTSNFFADIIFLFIFKFLYNRRIFCEINELRSAYVFNRYLSDKFYLFPLYFLKNCIDFSFYKMLERSFSYYNGLILISTNLDKLFRKINSQRIVIPIIVDVPKSVGIRIPLEGDIFNIGFFGTISFKKEGLLELFNSVKDLNSEGYNIKLNLYGPISNAELKYFQSILRTLDLSDFIEYHGLLPHSIAMGKMSYMNLLVLPRPWSQQTHYGFSTKLGEYLVSGVPVLVTDVSDNSLYIQDGYNGYIIDSVDSKSFSYKIEQIFTNYNHDIITIPLNAFETATNFFDYRRYSIILKNFLFYDI